MTVRLPVIGGDDNSWGEVLNTFLQVSHNGNGTLQPDAVKAAGAVTQVNGVSPSNGSLVLTAADVGADAGRLSDNRGAVQPSTAYSPGDVVAYKGQHVLISQPVTSTAWSNWYTLPSLAAGTYIPLNGKGVTYAADYGVVADSGGTDNTVALTKCLWGNGQGGIVVLPPGSIGAWIQVSNTIIVPSGTVLVGHGIEDTYIKLAANSNCDVIQFATYGSASQEAILSSILGTGAPSQYSIRNAFYSGLMNLGISGNAANQAAGDYHHGINATSNPVGSGAPTDPNFDPTNFLFNVEVTQCTGDGYNQFSSRGQMRVTDCLFRANYGWGVCSGTDTLYVGCNFAQNGLGGIVIPHGSASGSAAKIYNNGQAISGPWVSGTAYAAKARTVYNGQLYGAVNVVTSTTPPSADTANWVHITAATYNIANAASLWGTGMAFVSVTAQECTWSAVGFQENSSSDLYLQSAEGLTISGTSNSPNWNGPSAIQNPTNPGNNASVVLDNSSGNIIDIAATSIGTAYLLRSINGSAGNDLRFAGDSSWAVALSPDSTTPAGNRVQINGAAMSDVLTFALSAQSLGSGSTIALPTGSVARVTAASTVTSVTLAASTVSGQQLTVVNESAYPITFAASGSNVADGSADTIAANAGARFVWNGTTSLWYRV